MAVRTSSTRCPNPHQPGRFRGCRGVRHCDGSVRLPPLRRPPRSGR
ncbi:hypothetical protein F750_4788 [Streptomyces sp. PAMC 26508]|nr:hypothetical protein F750_4788 [Streptomyces sp. PAMC 26508]